MSALRLFWYAICLIPLLAICLLGVIAALVGFAWLDANCQRWLIHINSSRP